MLVSPPQDTHNHRKQERCDEDDDHNRSGGRNIYQRKGHLLDSTLGSCRSQREATFQGAFTGTGPGDVA